MDNNYFKLIKLLAEKKLTVATAESCTGGLIAKLITDVPGSSQVFIGGVVSYSNEMKQKLLGVAAETLTQFGAVSERTVGEMVSGVLKVTGADVGIAVSGIAGPTGGSPEKPVGTVIIGVSYRDRVKIERYFFKGSRKSVRKQSADQAATLLVSLINNVNDQ